MTDTKSLSSGYNAEEKQVFHDAVVAGPDADNVGGAPVEHNSPLGRQVGSFTVIAINVSMMIGTGICKCLFSVSS
jgi:hypothetical protein